MITQKKLSHQNIEGYRTYIQDLDVKNKKEKCNSNYLNQNKNFNYSDDQTV